EMHTKHWGGATGEDMTISSLVNTLTELEGIKYVLPSVEGMALNIEHMIVDHPLERMEEKIYKE
ncbi:MAG TPA: GerMN domain-containing protein, partial [Clostridiales bacterium]|nr:GerMN domain-containing protein [Clostridiales bacterium]